MSARPSSKPTETQYAAPMADHLLDVVEFLSGQHRPFGVTELSRRLGISTNAIFRLMRRLTDRGYAEIDPASKGYQLGSKFYSLGMRLSDRFDMRSRVRPHLEALCRDIQETCQAQILDGRRMLALEVVTPRTDFFMQIMPGARLYIHANAFGKAMLAFLEEQEVLDLLPEELPELTPETMTDRAALLASLEHVRRTGIAWDRGEYSRGVYCIAAPVLDVQAQPVAGVGLTGLDVRFDEEIGCRQVRAVLETAAAVAAEIGYDGEQYPQWLQRLSVEEVVQ